MNEIWGKFTLQFSLAAEHPKKIVVNMPKFFPMYKLTMRKKLSSYIIIRK